MRILAPAKINLFLEVLNRRSDGYHNIETIFQTVSLYDKITIEPRRHALSLECSSNSVPQDRRNLVLKAAQLLRKKLGLKSGAQIKLEKNIPAGAGLGGGSSDAAATLKGLLAVWKKRLGKKELLSLAYQLGADVPFFLYKGTAFASGIGERIEKLSRVKPAWFVLIYPRFSVSTAVVYRHIHFPLTIKQKINRIKELLSRGFSSDKWAHCLYNRLEKQAIQLYPEILHIKNTLKSIGFANLMSGSGSTIFILASSKDEAKRIRSRLKKYPWDTWVVRSVS